MANNRNNQGQKKVAADNYRQCRANLKKAMTNAKSDTGNRTGLLG